MKPNTLGSKVQTKPEKPIRPVSTLTSNKLPLNSRVFELPPMTAIFKEMGQFLQLQHVSTLKPYPCKFMPLASFSHPDFNPLPKVYTIRAFSGSPRLTAPLKFPLLQSLPTTRPRLVCKTNGSGYLAFSSMKVSIFNFKSLWIDFLFQYRESFAS